MEEFWGVEVKNGECLKVSPGDGLVLHLSQASLGELKDQKGNENIYLFVNVDGKKLVLGTLITNKLPQYKFDLLFDRNFELSHNWNSGSVYFYGYKDNGSKSKVDAPLNLGNNGKTESKAKQEKPAAADEKEPDAGCDPVKIAQTQNQEGSEGSFPDFMSIDSKDDPQVATSKKRPLESVGPSCEKKAKVTLEGTDDKKTAPLVGKEDKATPTDQPNKEKQKKYPCKSCNKLFTTEMGMEDHTKAKHGDAKQS